MIIGSNECGVAKFHKKALVNGVPKAYFIDFGSSVVLIKASEVSNIGEKRALDTSLPTLRGFGNSIVQPLGMCTAEVQIDNVRARVTLFIVPDHFLQDPLLVGRSFIEQFHVVISEDSVYLYVSSTKGSGKLKLDLKCADTVKIDGLTLVGSLRNLVILGIYM